MFTCIQTYCKRIGAYLVAIEDIYENNWLIQESYLWTDGKFTIYCLFVYTCMLPRGLRCVKYKVLREQSIVGQTINLHVFNI